MQFVRTIYWLAQILILSFLVNPFFYCLFFFSKEFLSQAISFTIESSVSRMIDTTSFCCDNNFHNVSYRAVAAERETASVFLGKNIRP